VTGDGAIDGEERCGGRGGELAHSPYRMRAAPDRGRGARQVLRSAQDKLWQFVILFISLLMTIIWLMTIIRSMIITRLMTISRAPEP